MPIVLPPKPTTSKALFEAATSLNNKLEKNAKRAEVIADQKAKQAFKEEQSIMEASMRRATMQKKYADFSEAVKGKLLNTAINDIAVRAKLAGINPKKIKICLNLGDIKNYLDDSKGNIYGILNLGTDKKFRKIVGEK